ncbi:hypothetical protein LRS10_22120 [Phenylobacterium sp. J426]|uniref:hypothetical protein n=1 Tax=Phenylobacterium sp. J426 TaxID=2898439 RepID=UPI002151DFCB|nr:hypothetical protein [Phenylobacterium sp. J426]MCR5876607.1 hypothetical protein [Phenylobacterium sp. J426]
MRRRVSRLALLGVLRSRSDGIWTSAALVDNPAHRRNVEAAYARLRDLYTRLSSLEELADLPMSEPWSGAPPLRAAARISGEYLLRLVDRLTALLHDPTDAAVWLEIVRSSTTLAPEDVAGPPALVRRPVARTLIARQLGLPSETVRRRIARLSALGACERSGAGLVVPNEVLQRADFAAVIDRNLTDLRRMFIGLAQLGALPAPAGVAAIAA